MWINVRTGDGYSKLFLRVFLVAMCILLLCTDTADAGKKKNKRNRKRNRMRTTSIPRNYTNDVTTTKYARRYNVSDPGVNVTATPELDNSTARMRQATDALSNSSQVVEGEDPDEGEEWDDEDMYFPEDPPEDDDDVIVSAEQRLMNNLLRNYERSVRPVKRASDTVHVKMGLTLTQIFDMDEKNQVLVTNVWLDQEWDDMFLVWDPADYDNLTILRLPCHKIWLPDIVLYNNGAQFTDGMMPANAMITHEGNVFWPVPTKLQSTCKVDVTYFPFDEQFCKLKFGSWTYDGFQVDMLNRTTEIDLSNYVANGEWELVSIKIYRNVVYYACCKEPFPDVTFIVHIRRLTLYYLYNVIFPCIMMSALTLLVFCLPPDSGEKITMGITVLLAFSVFMLSVSESLPETSEFIPLLSIYLTTVMAMTSVTVIMTVFVLNLHHRGPSNKPVPDWLKRVFLSKNLPKKRRRRNSALNRCRNLNIDNDESVPRSDSSQYIRNVSLRLTIENLAQELKSDLDSFDHMSRPNAETNSHYERYNADRNGDQRRGRRYASQYNDHVGNSVYDSRSRYTRPYRDAMDQYEQVTSPLLANEDPSCTKTNEEILAVLRSIIRRYEQEDHQDLIVQEWRQIAVQVDRILFWIFFFGTLASTLIVLVIAPITRFI